MLPAHEEPAPGPRDALGPHVALSGIVVRMSEHSPPPIGLSGRLSLIPLAEVMQWIATDRFTGSLVLRRSRREKQVYFRDGAIVGCISDDPAEFYGRCLIAEGAVTKQQVVQALDRCRRDGIRLGAALLATGALDESEVRASLERHMADRVCDLFLWQRGAFFVVGQAPPPEGVMIAPLDATALAFEGSRWADEHRRIRKVFIHDDIVLEQGPEWDLERLRGLERHVAERVDGQRTLGEIYSLVQGSHFRFLEAALDLTVQRVLDVSEIDDGEDLDQSREIGIFDLLLDQAADEEIVRLQQKRGAFAAELVESTYPVWIRAPAPERVRLMQERELRLCRALDGNVSIRDALSEDRGRAEKEIELIGLFLLEGCLALLPSSRSRLENELGGEVVRRVEW